MRTPKEIADERKLIHSTLKAAAGELRPSTRLALNELARITNLEQLRRSRNIYDPGK